MCVWVGGWGGGKARACFARLHQPQYGEVIRNSARLTRPRPAAINSTPTSKVVANACQYCIQARHIALHTICVGARTSSRGISMALQVLKALANVRVQITTARTLRAARYMAMITYGASVAVNQTAHATSRHRWVEPSSQRRLNALESPLQHVLPARCCLRGLRPIHQVGCNRIPRADRLSETMQRQRRGDRCLKMTDTCILNVMH